MRAVTPSQAMRHRLADYGVTTPISVILTGLDLQQFSGGDGASSRAGLEIDMGIRADRPLLLYVGRVAHEKNIDFLIETMDDIRRLRPDAVLLVTGEGPAEAHLHRLVERLGLDDNVVFTGYLDRKTTLLDCYAAADVFVSPRTPKPRAWCYSKRWRWDSGGRPFDHGHERSCAKAKARSSHAPATAPTSPPVRILGDGSCAGSCGRAHSNTPRTGRTNPAPSA